MKITVFAWHNSKTEITAIEKAGFVPNEVIEVEDAFLAIRKIYGDGGSVNVAILKTVPYIKLDRKDFAVAIAVSDDYFRQR